ncbi:ABC transporter permease [Sediminibacillus sp. JSM 1682029]|uniref:ABC transporter permease n=1 Tax=Sediminibacillus sp. JSM 1682029 TaxID=3229857 RepID=UPI0035268FAA
MLTILKLEIVKVLRNKRFIFFTLVVPLVLYTVLYNFSGSDMDKENAVTVLAIVASIFATVGSGLNTLSSRVTREKPYITNILNITPYSPFKFITITSLVQFFLNIVIITVIIVYGFLVFGLEINSPFILMETIILFSSIFYIFLGLSLGFLLDSVTLNTIAFPLYFFVMATHITEDLFIGSIDFPGFFTAIQKVFPGIYANSAVINIFNDKNFGSDFFILTGYVAAMFVISIFIYQVNKRKAAS